jgi:hypothetical protein
MTIRQSLFFMFVYILVGLAMAYCLVGCQRTDYVYLPPQVVYVPVPVVLAPTKPVVGLPKPRKEPHEHDHKFYHKH